MQLGLLAVIEWAAELLGFAAVAAEEAEKGVRALRKTFLELAKARRPR